MQNLYSRRVYRFCNVVRIRLLSRLDRLKVFLVFFLTFFPDCVSFIEGLRVRFDVFVAFGLLVVVGFSGFGLVGLRVVVALGFFVVFVGFPLGLGLGVFVLLGLLVVVIPPPGRVDGLLGG